MYQNNPYSNELCNLYSLRLSDMVKRGIRFKRKNGEWCGKAPQGYLNIHDNNDHFKPKIVKDPEHYNKVEKAFMLMLTGEYSIAKISEIVKLGSGFLRRAFRNPFYAGLNKDVDNPKVMYKGNWEPMITKGQYDKIQKMLEPKKKQNG